MLWSQLCKTTDLTNFTRWVWKQPLFHILQEHLQVMDLEDLKCEVDFSETVALLALSISSVQMSTNRVEGSRDHFYLSYVHRLSVSGSFKAPPQGWNSSPVSELHLNRKKMSYSVCFWPKTALNKEDCSMYSCSLQMILYYSFKTSSKICEVC